MPKRKSNAPSPSAKKSRRSTTTLHNFFSTSGKGTPKSPLTLDDDDDSDNTPPSPPPSSSSSPSHPNKKSNTYRIYCDLDGVLCDFKTAVEKIFNGKSPDDIPPGVLWSRIRHHNNFYRDLPWMRDGRELWNAISPLVPDILTGVPMDKKSRGEKAQWCKRELSGVTTNHVDMASEKRGHRVVSGVRRKGVVNVITCWSRNKFCESGRNAVLIDDRYDLKKAWEEKGGIFVHHTSTKNTLEILKEKGILPSIQND